MKFIKGYGDAWRFNAKKNGVDWSKRALMGFDTETTSADPMTARIVTAGILVDIPYAEPMTWEWLVNPEIEIELEATAIHGISTEKAMQDGIATDIAIQQILKTFKSIRRLYGSMPLVMVNAPFDLTIMRQEMIRLKLGKLEDNDLPYVIDTLTCDRKLDPYRRGRRTLTATAAAYGVTIKGAHQVLGDIQCSIKLARAMAAKYPLFATSDLRQLQQFQRNAHNEWCDNYEQYRQLDKTDFTISRGWPYQIGNE